MVLAHAALHPSRGLSVCACLVSLYRVIDAGTWHWERKKKILAKYPQVKQLYGQNPWTAVLVAVFVALQTWVAIKVADYSFPVVLLASYTVGAWWAFVLQGRATTHPSIHPLSDLSSCPVRAASVHRCSW